MTARSETEISGVAAAGAASAVNAVSAVSAVSAYRSALARSGPRFELLHGLAVAQHAAGDAFGAIESYRQCLKLDPRAAEIYNNLGAVLDQLGHWQDAIGCFQQALALKPKYVRALNNLGKVLRQAGRPSEALVALGEALELSPRNPATLTNLGFALIQLDRPDEAQRRLRRAVAIEPRLAEAHHGLGQALLELGDGRGALTHLERAVELKPELLEARLLLGRALLDQVRIGEAAAVFQSTLQRNPYSADAHHYLGLAQAAAGRVETAVSCYDAAIALDPTHAGAYLSRGSALALLQRLPDAMESFRKAAALRPSGREAMLEELYCRVRLCDWAGSRALLQQVQSSAQSLKNIPPFSVIAICDDPAEHLSACRVQADSIAKMRAPMTPPPRYRHDRLRLAYLSSDFLSHATAYLMAELFELHDRTAFQVFGVSYGLDDGSPIRRRIAAACEPFVDVTNQSDQQVASWLRAQEVDIAVDLKGYTAFARGGIFAHRPAPVQVAYLGYPGTTGAPYMDYLVADRFLIPQTEQRFYTEKIAYLPDSYQVNDRKRAISTVTPSRADVGLPSEGFVFCCFNNNWKITDAVFDIWVRLLKSVEGSVLWLLKDNPWAEENLKREAVARGVSSERLIFGNRIDHPDHLARHRLADLFLDTLPCNAHTTASDALWAGLPIVTCAGRSFAARVAGSLLRAVGLEELVTSTLEEYEQVALRLAGEPDRLGALRARLAQNREAAPLFDTPRFCRHLEAAYRRMWLLHERGLPAETFRVDVLPDARRAEHEEVSQGVPQGG